MTDQTPPDNKDPFNGLLEDIVTIALSALIGGLIIAYLLT
jgi:hypothetical protein